MPRETLTIFGGILVLTLSLFTVGLVQAQAVNSNPSGSTPQATVSPQTPAAGSPGSETGLVKCGVSRDCTICDLFILARDIFTLALQLLAALAVMSMVIGGIYMLVSAGNPTIYGQGVDIITNAVIGLLLVMASFLLFSFLLVGLGFQSQNFSQVLTFQSGRLFEVKCDNASTFGGQPLPGSSTGFGKCGTNRCGDVFATQIQREGSKVGVSPILLQALLDTETNNGTNCKTDAIRNEELGSRSCGLFQLNTEGALAECGITCEQALNVDANIACAAKFLKSANPTTPCQAAHKWNPGACSKTCQDIYFAYCSRTVSNAAFYQQCSQTNR